MDEQKKIDKLYALLEEKERKKDTEAAAALRWAIFELENGVQEKEVLLNNFTTKDLAEELATREGVCKKMAEPYANLTLSTEGPAVALIITD